MSITVLPINARTSGELCRLLEERGFGQNEYQPLLVEDPDGLIAWARGKTRKSKTTEEPVQLPDPLLKKVNRITIPALPEFKVSDFYSRENKKVKIGFVDPNLLKEHGGKVEKPTAQLNVVAHRLTRESCFYAAWGFLAQPIELTFGQIAWLVEQQASGRRGLQLTISTPNLFKVGSSLVYIYRSSNGWSFDVNLFGDDRKWYPGFQVVSGDSETSRL